MRRRSVIFWSLILSVAFLRFAKFGIGYDVVQSNCLGKNIIGQGTVVDEPVAKDSGQLLQVEVVRMKIVDSQVDCDFISKIKIKTKLYPRFSFNDKISFLGKLSEPANFGKENSFDYRGYLAKDDIFFEIKSAKVYLIDQFTDEDVEISLFQIITKKIISSIYKFKYSFENILKRNLGEPYSALATGLVVGEKAALGKELIDDFRTVGLIHIIVLSGYNITIVGDSLRKILIFLPRFWSISFGAIGITIFGIMVGGGATVVRTCVMACIALFAEMIRRDYSVSRALIFAGLMMLIINPKILLYDPSFQLSFLATFGLIIFGNKFDRLFAFVTEKFGLRSILSSTFATQIFVTPFLLYKMGQVSIVGIIVNILVLPIIPFTMLLVFLTGSIGLVYFPLSKPFALITHIFLSYEIFVVRKFASFPFASIKVQDTNFYFVCGYYATIFVWLIFQYARSKNHLSVAS